MIRTIEELYSFKTFRERFNYLKLKGEVGKTTFGYDRHLNQAFYGSLEWQRVRDIVLIRDDGCDLGISDYPIFAKVLIHHINPITIDDIKRGEMSILDPNFLITTSVRTHQAIHYSDESLLPKPWKERFRDDTKLW